MGVLGEKTRSRKSHDTVFLVDQSLLAGEPSRCLTAHKTDIFQRGVKPNLTFPHLGWYLQNI
jgi:hypothetical protein